LQPKPSTAKSAALPPNPINIATHISIIYS
jgi:hypothetical protein